MHKAEEEYWELKKETERLRIENEKARAENEKARAENEKARAENEKVRAENEKVRTENEKARAENEKAKIESDKSMEDLKKTLKELTEKSEKGLDRLEKEGEKTASTLRSLGFTIGVSTEELFLNSIEKTMEINGIKYYEITKNYIVCSKNGKQLAEIDALLFNKKYICVIEIKHRATKEDITKLIEKTIPTFQTEETKYQKYEIIPALAAMSFDKDVIPKAKKLNTTLLKYRGEHFQVVH